MKFNIYTIIFVLLLVGAIFYLYKYLKHINSQDKIDQVSNNIRNEIRQQTQPPNTNINTNIEPKVNIDLSLLPSEGLQRTSLSKPFRPTLKDNENIQYDSFVDQYDDTTIQRDNSNTSDIFSTPEVIQSNLEVEKGNDSNIQYNIDSTIRRDNSNASSVFEKRESTPIDLNEEKGNNSNIQYNVDSTIQRDNNYTTSVFESKDTTPINLQPVSEVESKYESADKVLPPKKGKESKASKEKKKGFFSSVGDYLFGSSDDKNIKYYGGKKEYYLV